LEIPPFSFQKEQQPILFPYILPDYPKKGNILFT